MSAKGGKLEKSRSREMKIVVSKDGPYLVSGNVPLHREIIVREGGVPVRWERRESCPDKESYALCRCGGSKDKPYCDGTHAKIGFEGKETASKKDYLTVADRFVGPAAELTDAKPLCSRLQFCHRAGGVWNLVDETDDPETKALMAEISGNCAAGRLVAWDKDTGRDMEPELEKSISVTQDPDREISCPLWVKGGIPVVSSDGSVYEVRNRVTLCRCGASHNKPFCDGTHVSIKFRDEESRLERTQRKSEKE